MAPTRRSSVLGVIGVISQRAAQVDDMSGPGGTSDERLTARFRSAVNDGNVKAIVFDVDSPGGGVYGVQELAEEIRAARGTKPIVAVANSLAASAAYWLASAADELVVDALGRGRIDRRLRRARGPVGRARGRRREGDAHLGRQVQDGGESLRAALGGRPRAIQGRVEDYYQAFVRAVAKGRGVAPDDVRKGFGQGRVVGAKEAVDEKMADRIDTLDETVRRVGGRAPLAAGAAESGAAPGRHGSEAAAAARYRLWTGIDSVARP
jgi:ClpP class serine protease